MLRNSEIFLFYRFALDKLAQLSPEKYYICRMVEKRKTL